MSKSAKRGKSFFFAEPAEGGDFRMRSGWSGGKVSRLAASITYSAARHETMETIKGGIFHVDFFFNDKNKYISNCKSN